MNTLRNSIETLSSAQKRLGKIIKDVNSGWNDSAGHEFIKIIEQLDKPIGTTITELNNLSSLISSAQSHMEGK
jgi:uncharacterized protein YukE